jgi:hypothetical protein
MNIKKYVGIASITLSLAIGIIAFLLVPKHLWNPPSILAFSIFTILSAYSFYSAVDSFGGRNGDASIIALSAPSGIIHFVLIVWSIFVLLVCFIGDIKLEWAWSMNVATITGIILSYLFFRVSATIIDDVVSNDKSKIKIVSWQSKLKSLNMVVKDEGLKVELESIEEKIRFSGFNTKSGSSEFDMVIDTCLQELENKVKNIDFQVNDDIRSILDKLKLNIQLRDSEIKGY